MVVDRVVRAPARLAALGTYVPERVLNNFELETMMDTSDEWILQRTGIRERRIVAENQYTSALAIAAVGDLLQHHPEIEPQSIDYVIAASSTSDYVYPGIAAMLQAHYGLPLQTGAIDVSAACAGFAYGVNLACGLIASSQSDRVLVVASEALSRALDYGDRATAVLFGDGAGAAIVERSNEPQILGMTHGADGSAGKYLFRTHVRSDINGSVDESRLLRQNGREVYRWVIEHVPETVERILARAGLTLDQIDWFAPHSANLRMIEALNKRIGFPMERTLLSVVDFGNTSAASIPLAVFPAIREGRVKPGERVLMVGFGGGLVISGNVVVV